MIFLTSSPSQVKDSLSTVGAMLRRYQRWMHNWEHRLTTRDTNRIVRPFEWGLEWLQDFQFRTQPPASNSDASVRDYFFRLNEEMVERSDEFFGYQTPNDFRLEEHPIKTHQTGSNPDPKLDKKYEGKMGTFLRFTSPIKSGFAENDLANARWFPAKGKRAMVIMPQWNSDAISHNGLGKLFNLLGVATLRLSMPYHDVRRPEGLTRADFAVSANMGRTLHATRQGVVDIRCCMDWLEQQGYTELGVLGTSLGSCLAFVASAHDPRIRVNIFNHASTYFGDVIWTGQATRHIREAVEKVISQEGLRSALLGISPMMYFDHYERWQKKSLMIYTQYDHTFLPEFSEQIATEFRRRGTNTKVTALPCGHYTLGETPYKYMDAWHICRFVGSAFS